MERQRNAGDGSDDGIERFEIRVLTIVSRASSANRAKVLSTHTFPMVIQKSLKSGESIGMSSARDAIKSPISCGSFA